MGQQRIEVFTKLKDHVNRHLVAERQIDNPLPFKYVHPRFPTVHRTTDGKIATN